MRRTRLGAALLTGLLLLTACGNGEPADDGTDAEAPDGDGEEQAAGCDTVTIASIHPLTGALALDGTQMDAAVEMAAEDLSGDDVTVEVRGADSQGEPETGQTEAQRLIQEGANVIIGAFQSAVTINLATIAQREQVPLIIDVAVADEITDPDNDYVFRLQPNASAMGEFGAQYLSEVAEAAGEEVSTVAFMHEETAFGTSVFEAFQSAAEDLGLEVVETISYNAFEVQDVTTELQRVAGSGADVLAITGYYNDGVLIAETAASVQPEISAIYGVAQGAYDLPQFPNDAADASEGILDSNYHFDATKDQVLDIRDRFEEETGDAMRTAAVFSYQAVEVAVEAARQAASCDGADMAAAIQDISVEDPLLTFPGPIEFDDEGENVNAQPVVMQVQDGEIVQVYPEEFAEAEPIFPTVPWQE